MSTPTVMIIRHGEKPVDDKHVGSSSYQGIDLLGQSADPPGGSASLIPQGWMRCGALGRFFVPLAGTPLRAGISVPTQLFAASAAEPCPATFSHSNQQPPQIVSVNGPTHSLREQELLLGVSALSQLAINATYARGSDERQLAEAVAALPDGSVALIAWEHNNIPKLAFHLDKALGAHVGSKIPSVWDGKRFDLVWVFAPSSSGYTFTQVPQMLLPGDNPEPLPV